MKLLALIVCFFLLCSIVPSDARRKGGKGKGGSDPNPNPNPKRCSLYNTHHWAYLDNPDPTTRGFMLLTLTWPGTFCSSERIQGNGGCKITTPLQPDFTIHGLWPNYANGEGFPSCCKTSPRQISGKEVAAMVAEDQDLTAELAIHWPDFNGNGFIVNEFNKHGTCAMEVFPDPLAYIKMALELKKEGRYFEALGLSPEDLEVVTERSAASLRYAFSKNGGPNVILHCQGRKLAEVRICIRKNDKAKLGFEPFDCPSGMFIHPSESSCDHLKSEVTIPPWNDDLFQLPAGMDTDDDNNGGEGPSGRDKEDL